MRFCQNIKLGVLGGGIDIQIINKSICKIFIRSIKSIIQGRRVLGGEGSILK
jgi:hypothetical protein